MAEHRFNVFGRIIAICGEQGYWSAWVLGSEGKRRKADFIVPTFMPEEELCDYLLVLFHEDATPTNGDVFRIE